MKPGIWLLAMGLLAIAGVTWADDKDDTKRKEALKNPAAHKERRIPRQ